MKQQSLRDQTFQGIDRDACIGPGHSRPEPGAKTRMYRVSLKPSDGGRMTVQLPAENKTKARVYVQNRWPRSSVSSIELVKR
jgi:hypothetical protein